MTDLLKALNELRRGLLMQSTAIEKLARALVALEDQRATNDLSAMSSDEIRVTIRDVALSDERM